MHTPFVLEKEHERKPGSARMKAPDVSVLMSSEAPKCSSASTMNNNDNKTAEHHFRIFRAEKYIFFLINFLNVCIKVNTGRYKPSP